ncbi:MAG: hypothetical protein EXR99_16730 [Gemmataceae bacterium]|nr:hypothetical protein [Gemmataceae bacterium]
MSSCFSFSSGVFPAVEPISPFREGYRKCLYTDLGTGQEIPMLAVAVSQEKVFDLFLDLTSLLGSLVDIILETSHQKIASQHIDLHREDVDLPVAQSYLRQFENTLTNDGCSGVAVMARNRPMEVQFDEHKIIVVYAQKIGRFEKVLKAHGIRQDDALPLVTDFEHCHATTIEFEEEFQQLTNLLGAVEAGEIANW